MGTEQRYLQKENGNTVSDAVAVDLFTEPHHNRRTCGKNKDDYDSREPKFKTAVVKCYLAVEKVEVICSTLNNTETDCYITSDSTDFASAGFAFSCQSLQRRNSNAEELDDD